MAKQVINNGEPLSTVRNALNSMFIELYGGLGGEGGDYITQPEYTDEPMATAFSFGSVAVGDALIFTEDSTMTFNDVTKVFEFADVTGASKYRGTGSKIECSYLGNVTEVITQNGTIHPILGYMAFDYSCYVRGDISAVTFSQPAATIKVSDLTFSLFDDMKAKADVVGAMAAKEFSPKDGTPETGYTSLKNFLDGATPAIKSGLWHFPANWLDLPTRGEDYIVQIVREFGGNNYTLLVYSLDNMQTHRGHYTVGDLEPSWTFLVTERIVTVGSLSYVTLASANIPLQRTIGFRTSTGGRYWVYKVNTANTFIVWGCESETDPVIRSGIITSANRPGTWKTYANWNDFVTPVSATNKGITQNDIQAAIINNIKSFNDYNPNVKQIFMHDASGNFGWADV